MLEEPGSGDAVDADRFRALMSTFPSGVAVVTTVAPDGAPHGLTCSSLCSVSLDPPLLLVCIHNASRTLAAILAGGLFAVNLLHERGEEVARLFSSNAADRFARVRWASTPGCGLPCLPVHASAVAECRVRGSMPAGDHTIVVGQVGGIETLTTAPPLLYGLRRYAAWPCPVVRGGGTASADAGTPPPARCRAPAQTGLPSMTHSSTPPLK